MIPLFYRSSSRLLALTLKPPIRTNSSSSIHTTTSSTPITTFKPLLRPHAANARMFNCSAAASNNNNNNNKNNDSNNNSNSNNTTNKNNIAISSELQGDSLYKPSTHTSTLSDESLNSSNTSFDSLDNKSEFYPDLNDVDIHNTINQSSLESLLDLEQLSENTFINKSELFIPYRGRGLFGGTMAAQSVLASLMYSNTLEKKWKPISIHCHFFHAAQPHPHLYYIVNSLKGGKNYCTNEVLLYQNDKLIFKATVSMQAYQLSGSASNMVGQLDHHRKAPVIGKDIAHFDDMLTQTEGFKVWSKKAMGKEHLEYLKSKNNEETVIRCYNREPCIWKLPPDMFNLDLVSENERNVESSERTLRYWVKNKEILKDPSVFNWVSIAYISDYFYLSANMRLNMHEMFTTKFSVSLDHIIYFNEEIDTSSYFNYNIKNIKAGENRSIMFGEMFSQDGTLAATTIQEGLSVVYTD